MRWTPRYCASCGPFGVVSRSEYSHAGVSAVWVFCSRLAVSPLLRLRGFSPASETDLLSRGSVSHLSSGFTLLQRPCSRRLLVCLPRRDGKHLSWAFDPYSTRGRGGLLHAGLPSRYVPPSGFGHPLDGLLPPRPCRFCFAPAALLGFTLRSFPLPQGSRRVSAATEPTCRFFVRCA